MKKIFTLLIALSISTQSYSQCEYLGGDVENFIDLTAAIDESGTLPANTIIAPEHHTSLFRLLTLVFAGFFIEPGTPAYEELWGFGLGLNMSDDSFTGDVALQIGGDENVNIADLYAVNACTEVPSGFKFSYKHIGEGADTLSVIVLMNEGALEQIPETEEDIMDAPAYANWNIIVDSTQTEYTTVTVPIIDNDLGVAIDTAVSFIIVTGDTEYLQTGQVSHFLIDDISYSNESSLEDNDMDGFFSDVDCDDNNADINPNATEIANNDIDEDCDGVALVIDNDMDGFNSDEDCDDENADINPNATEVANNDIDEDCDGVVLIIDNDMDGFNSDEDCDDENADINPNATEIPGNEIDEDCDGLIDPSSVEDISKANVEITPNPAYDNINLVSDKNITIEILDLSGRSILNIDQLKKNHFIDISEFNSGFYIVKITDSDKKSQLQKIIVR